MPFFRWFLVAFGICALTLGASVSAAELTEGRWAVRVGDRPIMVLELRKDTRAKGGWVGSLVRPRHFTVTATTFRDVRGPVIAEPIVEAHPTADVIELTFRDSSGELVKMVWQPLEGGGGDLKVVDWPISPFHFQSASTSDRVNSAWDSSMAYVPTRKFTDSGEMKAIFEADQAIRASSIEIDSAVASSQDAKRRAQTRTLLNANKLSSGNDFWRAAFVLQHGDKPQDYLTAHTLAMIAEARGRPDATWIAAATLDRYLQSIGQKQIYGTQYETPSGKATTQEPYDRDLISDSLRDALGVPPVAAQDRMRLQLEQGEDQPNGSRGP